MVGVVIILTPVPPLRRQDGANARGVRRRGAQELQGGGGPKAPRLLENLTRPPVRLPLAELRRYRGRGEG